MPTAIAELVDQFPMPAILVSRYRDVLAANPIAHALSPGLKWDRTSRVRAPDPSRPATTMASFSLAAYHRFR
jgi:hypothetical protein